MRSNDQIFFQFLFFLAKQTEKHKRHYGKQRYRPLCNLSGGSARRTAAGSTSHRLQPDIQLDKRVPPMQRRLYHTNAGPLLPNNRRNSVPFRNDARRGRYK